jgi:hypothetical protein
MKETEWDVRWVTVPWMNRRSGNSSSSEANDEVDDAGDRGGVGNLEEDAALLPTGRSGDSSIFVYGIKALGAWVGKIENRGNT